MFREITETAIDTLRQLLQAKDNADAEMCDELKWASLTENFDFDGVKAFLDGLK